MSGRGRGDGHGGARLGGEGSDFGSAESGLGVVPTPRGRAGGRVGPTVAASPSSPWMTRRRPAEGAGNRGTADVAPVAPAAPAPDARPSASVAGPSPSPTPRPRAP